MLKDATLKLYVADLDHRLNRIMAAARLEEPGRKGPFTNYRYGSAVAV